jgi:sugar-specific transcriptional regulator TrmB
MSTRDEIINAIQSQAGEIQAKFEELKGRAEVQAKLGEAEAREFVQPLIDDVEREINNATQKIDEIRNSSEEAAEEMAHGANLAIKALRMAFDKAVENFR